MPADFPQLQVMQQIGRTYRALLTAFDAQIGQPMPRWRVLLMLYQLGETSQKELACKLRMDPASLTRQIKVIERLGWIRRHNDSIDNRLTNVVLTPAGRAVVEQTLPRRTAFIENALTDLSLEQMDELSTMLDRLEKRLRAQAANLAG
jgi:DNA-binding MarR family transcriptional regulator